ncbi:Uncharacterised protein [Vibrio cholerae]|nr:Uncharacterised protein [Vibrio cholerae]
MLPRSTFKLMFSIAVKCPNCLTTFSAWMA